MLAKSILRLVSPYLRQLLELLRAEAIKLRARSIAELHMCNSVSTDRAVLEYMSIEKNPHISGLALEQPMLFKVAYSLFLPL